MELTRPPARTGSRGVGRVRSLGAALGVIACMAVSPFDAAARQNAWAVGSHAVQIEVSEAEGAASVTSRLRLVPVDPALPPDPDASLTIELLVFGDVTLSDLRRANGDRVLMWPASGRRLVATLAPPFDQEEGTPGVVLSYVVEGAVSDDGPGRHVRVPLVAGPVRSTGGEESGASGVFSAVVDVPDGWRVNESFPTGLTRGLGNGPFGVSLPVTPAMVSFRASTDGAWRPGFPLLVDVLTLTVLLGFAAFGWRHLSGVVAGRRAEQESAA